MNDTSIHNRVKIEFRQQLAVVTLARPDKYNGLDMAMMLALDEAARTLRKRREIRAVILHGQGPAFSAGLDFASVLRRPGKLVASFLPWWRKANLFQRLCLAWRDLDVPVIAVTHGYCFGGGFQLALGCDFRISSPDCQFSIKEIEWGLIPDMGASITLRELLPADQALELTLTGRQFDAQEALDKHLITRIDDDPLNAALALAETIAAHSPDAVAAAKRLFQQTRVLSERRALRRERWLQLKVLLGSNQREAMKARMEKREPRFKSR
ncbi:MAG: crotonase/enoyl-CoA hydratase family protein [Wenzhouxiangella sp.]|jgi:enoyl-CoA hydratase/carnithine racemase|nr:crotonase/enoyl-CoA hydratase family protein [Wenzhouxiangella sp.]